MNHPIKIKYFHMLCTKNISDKTNQSYRSFLLNSQKHLNLKILNINPINKHKKLKKLSDYSPNIFDLQFKVVNGTINQKT